MRGLLIALAVAVTVDVALVLGANRQPSAIVVTHEPAPAGPGRASSGGTMLPSTSVTTAETESTCRTPSPSPTWVCQNGVWVMVALTTSDTTGNASSSGVAGGAQSSAGGAGNCPGVQPGAGWTCRGGSWSPPFEIPNITPSTAGASQPSTASSPSTSPTSQPSSESPSAPPPNPSAIGCVGSNPAAGLPRLTARCVNGTWIIGG